MELVRAAYVGGFLLAAAVCLLSLRSVSKVTGPDTRRGLAALLATTGLWSITHAGRLLPVAPRIQATSYLVGLVFGLATVGAWLYFCSAYTGHDYHRRSGVRRAALAVFILVTGAKLTNPLHGLYFTTTATTQPFRHVVIQLGILHWIVTGVAYAASAIGFYLLYEMFSESKSDVTALAGLAATTALPVVFYLLSLGDGGLITLHYEPIGVAVFAVGVLYVVDEEFLAVPQFWRSQVIEELDEAVLLVDTEPIVRDYNRRAVELFPQLADTEGELLPAVVPDLAETLDADEDVLTARGEAGGETRHYHVSSTQLTSGDLTLGQAVICTDVTETERQRRQLTRYSEQFDELGAALTHELRNALAVAEGYSEMVADSAGESSNTAVEAVRNAHSRMDRIIDDLATLAQYGQAVGQVEPCGLRGCVEAAVAEVEPTALEVRVEQDTTVVADPGLLTDLFASAVRFAVLRDATGLAVSIDEGQVTIAIDGASLDEVSETDLFAYGEAVPSAETGTLFPTMRTIALSHGWTVDVDPECQRGMQIRVDGVEAVER
ncbi:MAG: histidine kinase N-terminal 7TM domain-containing protein [Haloferacaceae archaeon]